ncbi:hypothetical protein [Mycobacterium sp. C31M]
MAEPSNDQPMESHTADDAGSKTYPPPPPPSEKRTIDLAKNSGRRCTAHRKNGEQCRKWAIYGSTVCKTHGGAAPQVVAKAQQRLREASDRMTQRLLGMAESENIPAYVALQAINSALDRAGVVEQKQMSVEVTAKPFEDLLADIEGGSRADYRRSVGHPDPEPHFPAIESAHRTRPGDPTGVRVLGATFDGHAVIDGELVAGDDQGDRTPGPGEDVADDGAESLRASMANPVTPLISTQGGFLPAEDAMTQAAEANRAHKRKMRRR